MNFRNQNIVVVGAGVSGLAICRLLIERGARVTLSDRQSRESIPNLDSLDPARIRFDLGGHCQELFTQANLIVLSPGVPTTIPAVQAAMANDVPVFGEIELAARETDLPIIGITGTNGKSTTTALLGEILNKCGKRAFVGGNLGEPLTSAVGNSSLEWLVVELSSFQLETIDQFHPRYGMLLNISADHLDRYDGMTDYVDAKLRLFRNMTARDRAILNADDPLVVESTTDVVAEKIWFSTRREIEAGMFLQDGNIVWRRQGEETVYPVAELRIKGLHNIENAMAAMIPALCEGCPGDLVWQAVCDFRGLPHRMELVRTLDGVDWFNDSKGTNVGSVAMSLSGLTAPVTLIAGGKDKGGDFRILSESVREKVAQLILIGEAAERMELELGDCTSTVRAETLEEAVAIAQDQTPAGGTVLLSPGCSSFDMFASYIERGEIFNRLVDALKMKEAI